MKFGNEKLRIPNNNLFIFYSNLRRFLTLEKYNYAITDEIIIICFNKLLILITT